MGARTEERQTIYSHTIVNMAQPRTISLLGGVSHSCSGGVVVRCRMCVVQLQARLFNTGVVVQLAMLPPYVCSDYVASAPCIPLAKLLLGGMPTKKQHPPPLPRHL